jgi:hypothetical protein
MYWAGPNFIFYSMILSIGMVKIISKIDFEDIIEKVNKFKLGFLIKAKHNYKRLEAKLVKKVDG